MAASSIFIPQNEFKHSEANYQLYDAMKVLHVIHSIDPRSGGPSHALRELVRNQITAGHAVTILATDIQSTEPFASDAEFRQRIQQEPSFSAANICLLKARWKSRLFRRYGYSRECVPVLKTIFAKPESRPDILHIHGTFSHLTATAAKVASKYKIPFILRPAGSLNLKCLKQRSQWLKHLFILMSFKRDLRRANIIHAMSKSELDEIVNFAPSDKTRIVPHGVTIPDPVGDLPSKSLFVKIPELKTRPFLLYLGRIHAKKRPEMIVEALSKLRDEYPDLALLVAGNDSGHLHIVRQAVEAFHLEDSVFYSGFLQGALKTEAFHRAKAFVLPSIDENFGVSVIEAMAHGTPVVVTPGVATHLYVNQSQSGITVPGDVNSLAIGIRKILESERSEIGQRGRQFVQENLDWKAVTEKVNQLYLEAVTSNV